jgi:hypothetical protein
MPQYFDESLRSQSFAATAESLRREVAAAEPRLRALREEAAGESPAAGKWSPKQVLGHLIDSAANNHQRFVRGQATDELRLPGYEQEHWVGSQRYDEREWTSLVELWAAYNRHLAHVISRIPEDRRDIPCRIGDNPPVTLSHVAIDYVAHLQHHLRQVFAAPG